MTDVREDTFKTGGGGFSFVPSATIKVGCGCGNLYAIICHDDKGRFKRLFIPRNSKFHCPLIHRYHLEKLATFQGRRNLGQLVKDLRGEKPIVNKVGHYCDNYSVGVEATSCEDAISKAIEKWSRRKELLNNPI